GLRASLLVMTPQEPVVPFGGSTELNCSLACAGGKVEWRGLDTALGTISSFPTHSILHIRDATVATEGMKICQGSCHGQHYQKTVALKVYGKRSPAHHCLPAYPHFCAIPGFPIPVSISVCSCSLCSGHGGGWAAARSPVTKATPGPWPPQHLAQARVSLHVMPPQHRNLTLAPPWIWLLSPNPPPRGTLCPGTSSHTIPQPPPRGQGHLWGQCPPAACRSGHCHPPGCGAGPCASSAGHSAPGTPRWAGSGPPQPSHSTRRSLWAAALRCGWTGLSPGTRAATCASCSATAPRWSAWRWWSRMVSGGGGLHRLVLFCEPLVHAAVGAGGILSPLSVFSRTDNSLCLQIPSAQALPSLWGQRAHFWGSS
uniref:Immunoglobulin domain-containing protein n=1 Tax=Malurus cyaneus samueli TaxID=2593467 RepID=A0A8C5UEZ6_9PASS